ncbi:MAG: saccharopine dehydrogenase C-terminal domain-containing protein [Pseudomonadota bacterium]
MTAVVPFKGRLILVGCGTVGNCLLDVLPKALGFSWAQLHVIDARDCAKALTPFTDQGATFHHHHMTLENMARTLDPIASAGDLLINLTIGVDSLDLADWCHQNGVLYLDTAVEPWEELVADPFLQPPDERTEYFSHQRARKQAAERWRPDGATAVVAHGANPGLVSHFAKAALLEVAHKMGLDFAAPDSRQDWAVLAQATGTKVIHISERDTQISAVPKRPDEFVNTWSIPGFVEESMMSMEIGWGSHEKSLPQGAMRQEKGPRNTIYVDRPASSFLVRSWVPLGGQIAGLALPHSETVTISDYLTVTDGEGGLAYRPTVAFSYLACDGALASLHETMMRDWAIPARQRIMNSDIIEGRDELGILLLGHGLNGWWYGSQLSVAEARTVVPGHNPTAIQVAAGVAGAAVWAVRNPNKGYCEAEDLPHEEVLEVARPFLGTMASLQTDWNPLSSREIPGQSDQRDNNDPWQFGNFLIAR